MVTRTEAAGSEMEFYAEALQHLVKSGVPFLIGGAYALRAYTGIARQTKDLDVFSTAGDYPRILEVLAEAGYQTEIVNPSWLAKAFSGDYFVDVIWNGANQLTPVDDSWFEGAREVDLFGSRVKVVTPADLIWSKSYVETRERSDVPDVLHLILKQGRDLDWKRLLTRMQPGWEILFAHILTFWYVYPSERNIIPDWLIEHLISNVQADLSMPRAIEKITRGLQLSKSDFRIDLEWGFNEP